MRVFFSLLRKDRDGIVKYLWSIYDRIVVNLSLQHLRITIGSFGSTAAFQPLLILEFLNSLLWVVSCRFFRPDECPLSRVSKSSSTEIDTISQIEADSLQLNTTAFALFAFFAD